MNRRVSRATLFVPTLVDSDGLRHIIPGKDMPAYCKATGEQMFPKEHRASTLCQRCVQKYMKKMFGDKLGDFGL